MHSKGRTGARGRANIAPPPTPAEVEAARREATICEDRLADLAAGHPSAKVWRSRLRVAKAVLARA